MHTNSARLDLDGKPRPIHHDPASIQWDRDTRWVQENLLHQVTEIYRGEHDLVERTGLHVRGRRKIPYMFAGRREYPDHHHLRQKIKGGNLPMSRQIKTVYVIHHSHTDIGYTDLQERVIDTQADYIRTVLDIMAQPENTDFRWNCETLFCVEEFFKAAAPEQQEAFCRLAAEGKIGLSANYLNFNDLVDCQVYGERLAQWQARFAPYGAAMKTAMILSAVVPSG